MKKRLEQLADLLSSRPLVLVGCALVCAALAGALLINQVLLGRSVESRLAAASSTAPQIHWYGARTTAPQTQAPVQSVETRPAAGDYVLNTNSKKIHRPDCRYAESLKPENRGEATEADLPGLLADGYTYCSVCCG